MEPCIFETGPDVIHDAIQEQVAWMFADAEEIGSSDVSACVQSVFASLGCDANRANDHDYDIIRVAVIRAIVQLQQTA